MSLSKFQKLPAAAAVADTGKTQTRSQRAGNTKGVGSTPRGPRTMPVFEGVEMLQYVENGPSPNYRPWYEQLA